MLEFKFASAEEGRKALIKKDDYLKELSTAEFALKMKSNQVITEAEFLDFLQSCILEWNEEETAKLSRILSRIKNLINLRIDIPEPILLIKTKGKEEWNSAYTRGNSVILPLKRIKNKEERLLRLLVHEIFHIISRSYPSLRNILYGLIGFEKIKKVRLPEEIRTIKLTNPDAPYLDYFTSVYYKDTLIPVLPITVLKTDRENVNSTQDILNSISTKLLAIEKENGEFKVVQNNIMLSPGELQGLKNKLNIDLNNLQHPEELLANLFTSVIKEETNKVPGKVIKGIYQFILADSDRREADE